MSGINEYTVQGMTCSSCATKVNAAVSEQHTERLLQGRLGRRRAEAPKRLHLSTVAHS
jgi:cation transport ATPase